MQYVRLHSTVSNTPAADSLHSAPVSACYSVISGSVGVNACRYYRLDGLAVSVHFQDDVDHTKAIECKQQCKSVVAIVAI
jgi:hypothetical protein